MTDYILGIDIGTTSVKVCIVNIKTSEVAAQHLKDTQSNIPSDTGPGGNKQDVPKIISALNLCVSKLPKQLLQEVSKSIINIITISLILIISEIKRISRYF